MKRIAAIAFFLLALLVPLNSLSAAVFAESAERSLETGESDLQTESSLETGEDTLQQRSGMIVIERTTNRVLMGENEHAPLPMASLTKVMTAIVAIENCRDLDAKHPIPKAAVGIEGSSIYLVEGEELSVRELLYGLMLRSGNDSAVALAILTGGSTEEFVAMMNAKVADLGLAHTKFQNPNGLSAKDHYTSCYDLAVITSYAMENELFREVVGTKQITISNTTKDYPRVLKNKNKMLWEFEGGCGVKTGYTKEAGRCLVSAAERGNLKLVCVVLNCGPMWEVSKACMEDCFAKYEFRTVLCAGQIDRNVNVTGGLKEKAGLYLKQGVSLLVDKNAELEVVFDLPETIAAPVAADQIVGEVRIYAQKELLFSQKIYNIEKIEIQTQKIFEKIFGNWSLI